MRKKGFRAVQGDINSINERDRYDVVVFFDVLEHVPDPCRFLNDVRARLKDKGQIMLTTPSTRSFVAMVSGAKWVSYIVPHHVLIYEPGILKKCLKDCGFGDVMITTDIQWVPLSFLNERIANLLPCFKGLTGLWERGERSGRVVWVPVPNGNMLVCAKKIKQ
jgi:hypothetical protein